MEFLGHKGEWIDQEKGVPVRWKNVAVFLTLADAIAFVESFNPRRTFQEISDNAVEGW